MRNYTDKIPPMTFGEILINISIYHIHTYSANKLRQKHIG